MRRKDLYSVIPACAEVTEGDVSSSATTTYYCGTGSHVGIPLTLTEDRATTSNNIPPGVPSNAEPVTHP